MDQARTEWTMATVKKKKLKCERKFLEPTKHSDSYYVLDVSDRDYTSLKLADCEKTINWSFGKPGDERAMAKIKVVKSLIDRLHDYLVPEDKR